MKLEDINKMIKNHYVGYSFDDIEGIRDSLKKSVKELDIQIDNLLKKLEEVNYFERYCYIDGQYHNVYQELEKLSDQRYLSNRYLGRIETELLRRRRAKYEDVSKKALNHGGIYTYGHDVFSNASPSKKVRGWRGVTL